MVGGGGTDPVIRTTQVRISGYYNDFLLPFLATAMLWKTLKAVYIEVRW